MSCRSSNPSGTSRPPKKHGATAKLIRKQGKGHGWATILWDIRKFANWFDEHLEPPVQPSGR